MVLPASPCVTAKSTHETYLVFRSLTSSSASFYSSPSQVPTLMAPPSARHSPHHSSFQLTQSHTPLQQVMVLSLPSHHSLLPGFMIPWSTTIINILNSISLLRTRFNQSKKTWGMELSEFIYSVNKHLVKGTTLETLQLCWERNITLPCTHGEVILPVG